MYLKQTFCRYNVLYVTMFENILLDAALVHYIFCFKNLLLNIRIVKNCYLNYHRFICFVLLYCDRQRSHLPVVKAFCKLSIFYILNTSSSLQSHTFRPRVRNVTITDFTPVLIADNERRLLRIRTDCRERIKCNIQQ